MKTTSYQLEPLIKFLCLISIQSDLPLTILSEKKTDNFKKGGNLKFTSILRPQIVVKS